MGTELSYLTYFQRPAHQRWPPFPNADLPA